MPAGQHLRALVHGRGMRAHSMAPVRGLSAFWQKAQLARAAQRNDGSDPKRKLRANLVSGAAHSYLQRQQTQETAQAETSRPKRRTLIYLTQAQVR
jgi:hypothetical protein